MYTLNITVRVETDILQQWLHWVKTEYVPVVLESECFKGWQLHQLLGHEEADAQTYVLQFYALNIDAYSKYTNLFDDIHRNRAFARWGHRALEFRTVLKRKNGSA